MTHFVALVRVPKDEADGLEDVRGAVEGILEPFNEQPPDGSPYRQFEDHTDDWEREFNTGTVKRVCTSDGEIVLPWDERFRVGGTLGLGTDTHKIPDDCEEIDVPYSEVYKDFDTFVGDYHGGHEENGRWGYRNNPDAKWDWWQIGGRWTGFIHVKNGAPIVQGRLGVPAKMAVERGEVKEEDVRGKGTDVCRIKDVDLAYYERRAIERANAFFDSIERLKDIKRGKITPADNDPWIGFDVVDKLADMGLMKPYTGPRDKKETAEEFLARVVPVTREELLRDYRWAFEFSASAFVDTDGEWHEVGTAGWFGTNSATPEDRADWSANFVNRLINTGDPEDWLAVVDCHI